MSNENEFHDPMVLPGSTSDDPKFFDRFMFNLHPNDAARPSIIMGLGHYPGRNVADGYTIISLENEQRNIRFSTELNGIDGSGVGPFSFKCVEPNKVWRLKLGENPMGVEFDVTWEARAPYWLDIVKVENAGETPTNFEHLVQSGRYSGSVSIDGVTRSVDGWYGQRDRSRGVRTMQGGQGLHIWFQAQFDDRAIGFLLVEGRDGSRMILDGAVMLESGTLDYITDVSHNLQFNDLDLMSGVVEVVTESGERYHLEADASGGGGFMAGAGYGGHHGKPKGVNHVETDCYPFDGSVSQRTLDTSLTDRVTRFSWDGQTGYGIFEFALSRSSSYNYKPTGA